MKKLTGLFTVFAIAAVLSMAGCSTGSSSTPGTIDTPDTPDTPVTPDLPVTHVVTFVAQGKTIDSQTVEDGQLVTKPSDPANGSYTFKDWYNGDSEYQFSAPVTSDLTLTAKWSKVTKITYVSTVTYTDFRSHTGSGWITLNFGDNSFEASGTEDGASRLVVSGTFSKSSSEIRLTILADTLYHDNVGKTSVYTIQGDTWTWSEGPKFWGFGNSKQYKTIVTATDITQEDVE